MLHVKQSALIDLHLRCEHASSVITRLSLNFELESRRIYIETAGRLTGIRQQALFQILKSCEGELNHHDGPPQKVTVKKTSIPKTYSCLLP